MSFFLYNCHFGICEFIYYSLLSYCFGSLAVEALVVSGAVYYSQSHFALCVLYALHVYEVRRHLVIPV